MGIEVCYSCALSNTNMNNKILYNFGYGTGRMKQVHLSEITEYSHGWPWRNEVNTAIGSNVSGTATSHHNDV